CSSDLRLPVPAGGAESSTDRHRRLSSTHFGAGGLEHAARIDRPEGEPLCESARDRERSLLAQERRPADPNRAAGGTGLQLLAHAHDDPGVSPLLEVADSLAVEALLAAVARR